mmetsp:Transcript_9298/g.39086  ORF Transcript_9298/g.39086 Transcript_9298/m.39086 type:complete len:246 (-) Transcript_9298:269-1006(-)
MGSASDATAGHRGRVAAVSEQVALLRAHLQLRGDHEADPHGGRGVHEDGPELAAAGGGDPRTAGGDGRAGDSESAGGFASREPRAGRRGEGPERFPRHQEAGVPAVLLPVQRRAARDPLRGEGPAEDPAVHEEVLRGGEGSGVHGQRHDARDDFGGGRARAAEQRDRPRGDKRGGVLDARVRGRHEGVHPRGHRKSRGGVRHEAARTVDPGVAGPGGPRRVAGALDRRGHRRHRAGRRKEAGGVR